MVEQSLIAAGFGLPGPSVAIVETRRPGARPFDVVLAQSPWNVLSVADFVQFSEPYPASMRRRMWARRAVAAVNLRRAHRVLCLTEANAEQVRRTTGREVDVAPVWLPLDFIELSPSTGRETSQGLVPGTLTWFKNPAGALDVARRRGIRDLVFAGRDDGSGCWPDVVHRAASAGVTVSRTIFTRQEMCDEVATAAVVILPSRLETLGFSLCEALSLNPHVLASALPSHREVAGRLGVDPLWLTGSNQPWPRTEAAPVDADAVRASWLALGEALGLERQGVDRDETALAPPRRVFSYVRNIGSR